MRLTIDTPERRMFVESCCRGDGERGLEKYKEELVCKMLDDNITGKEYKTKVK